MSNEAYCHRGCVYQNHLVDSYESYYGCRRLELTGESRVKAVYNMLGVKEMTRAARELLRPENCPCFVPEPEKEKKKREEKKPEQRVFFDETEIRRLHGMGLLDSEIAKMQGVSAHTIHDRRKKLGLKPNFVQTFVYDWDKAKRLHAEGKTDGQIAAELGCSRTSVTDWRKREGLLSNYAKR